MSKELALEFSQSLPQHASGDTLRGAGSFAQALTNTWVKSINEKGPEAGARAVISDIKKLSQKPFYQAHPEIIQRAATGLINESPAAKAALTL